MTAAALPAVAAAAVRQWRHDLPRIPGTAFGEDTTAHTTDVLAEQVPARLPFLGDDTAATDGGAPVHSPDAGDDDAPAG